MTEFAVAIMCWQRAHGRRDLPWQGTRDPYAIWLAEIMLQQTQAITVAPYYRRFRANFPDIASLAAASEDEVLRQWSGLGYYSRARNLHRAARLIVEYHNGEFPHALEDIMRLPGIGRSTAAAIAAFAYGVRAPIMDGNVKRVLARHFMISGFPGEPGVAARLWRLAESLLPASGIETYIQGLMDLGATVCVRRDPHCGRCPVCSTCGAYAANRVGELPIPRPRRTKPTRRTNMLVLRYGDCVLLERRAPVGVWGGLWSLPELDEGDDVISAAAQRFGCTIAGARQFAKLRHGFTHFTLEITALVASVSRVAPSAAHPKNVWLSFADALEAALPAPVRKILAPFVSSAAADHPALLEEAI
jgi:A/G-specific adenine glycosylase